MQPGDVDLSDSVLINAAPDDMAALAAMIEGLSARGVRVAEAQAHPVERSPDAKMVLTVWSRNSLLDEDVVARALLASRVNKMLPIQIDDVDPPLGFRQIQTIPVLDLSEASADLLTSTMAGDVKPRAVAAVTRWPVGEIIDGLVFSALFVAVSATFLVYVTPLALGSASNTFFVYLACVQTSGFAFLLPLMHRVPTIFFARLQPRRTRNLAIGLAKDLCLQAPPVISFALLWIGAGMVDRGLVVGTPWVLPLVALGASLSAVLARWGVATVTTAVRRSPTHA